MFPLNNNNKEKKKMIKVGINGFGRIGRMVFRAAVQNFSDDIQIVGINDLLDPDYLAYMLKYDSVHGKFDGEVAVEGNYMIVNGNKIITYDNDQPPAWTAIMIVCSILFLLGTGFLFAYRAAILHNRKQQKKRDERIVKKYGSLKK